MPAKPTESNSSVVWLRAKDGTALAAHRYEPASGLRGAVVLASAMGVPQSFYRPLAAWLAERGFGALTFDYRGMGASRLRPLRLVVANIETWAEQDAGAALAAARERWPAVPITWLGHSLGGQIIPLVPGMDAVSRLILVASGSGYWRENAPPLRKKVWLFWFGAVPLLTPLFGYFPGKRIGMVADLPRGVIDQWRRWCLHPEYSAGVEGPALRARYAGVRQPLTSISFTDDEMLSTANFRSLFRFFPSTASEFIHDAPAAHGLTRVGHFGFFRPAMADTLWPTLLLPRLAASVSE